MYGRRMLLLLLPLLILMLGGWSGLTGDTSSVAVAPATQLVQPGPATGWEANFWGRQFFDIRFYRGSHIIGSYAYWLEGERGDPTGDRWLFSCCNRRSPVVFSVYFTDHGEANVHAGIFRSSPIKIHLEHGTAYAGNNNHGPALWSLCGGGNVCLGKGGRRFQMYHVEEEQVFPGGRVSTEVLMTADRRIDNDPMIMLIMPILIEELWQQW